MDEKGQDYVNGNVGCSIIEIPCSISFNNNWELYSYHIFPWDGSIEISYMMFRAVNLSAYLTADWYNNGVTIGVVDGPCLPYQTKYAYQTIGNRQWVVSVSNTGVIKIRLQNLNAPIPQNNEQILLSNLQF